MVYFNSTLYFGVEIFQRSYKKSIVIGRNTFYAKIAKQTRQYVLFGSSLTNIVHALQWMRDHEFDNTGKYIIICQSLVTQECDEVLAIKVLWEHKIINVIFLKSLANEVVGYSYFPLNNSLCINDEPVRLASLTSCLNAIDYQESCDLFPMKLKNFNKCTLTISTFIHPPYMEIKNGIPSGTDGDLLLLIAEKLNASLTMMTPKIGDGWGWMNKNGSWAGSLSDILNDLANFSMTSAALTLSRFSNFQLSRGYNSEYVVWITHSAEKIPSSLKFTYPFQANARIVLGISFAVVVLCSSVFQSKFYLKLIHKLKLERPQSSVIFYSWMVCMGMGVPKRILPKKTVLLNIVLLWIWYCFLVRTFYQVSLISVMKTNYYFEEFDSIDDAIDEKYLFGGGAALRDYYIDYPAVYDNWKDVDTSEIIPTLRKISDGKEFVLAMSMMTARTVIWKEKIKVHMLPRKVVTSPTVVFFKKYSPLADVVNVLLDRLHESGFSEKFFKDYAPVRSKEDEKSLESIRLEHYTGCYAVLITGWVVSFLLLVGEFFFPKIFIRQNTIRIKQLQSIASCRDEQQLNSI